MTKHELYELRKEQLLAGCIAAEALSDDLATHSDTSGLALAKANSEQRRASRRWADGCKEYCTGLFYDERSTGQ